MLNIIIIKLIINLLLLLFSLWLYFKTENLFGAQFGELENVYIKLQRTHINTKI